MSDRSYEFPADAFAKVDPTDDAMFYAPPRLVTHIDEMATAVLTAFYLDALPRDGVILDLMSSWISHLPVELEASAVIGHGMNQRELDANPRLTRRFVQDLNQSSTLPIDDASVDAALCCVGVQYLQRPVEVFSEVARTLRPGSPFIVSFSNRCFPTKAVAIWRALDGDGHASLVRVYLERAGFTGIEIHVLADGRNGDPLTAVVGMRP
jgi:SAM-dependent methyltransferase